MTFCLGNFGQEILSCRASLSQFSYRVLSFRIVVSRQSRMEYKLRLSQGTRGSAPDVVGKLGQMKQKLSSLDFIDAVDQELGISRADDVAAKYASSTVAASMRDLRFPTTPLPNSSRSVHPTSPRFLPELPGNDSLHSQIKDLEAGFTRLSKLTGQPADNFPESQRGALLKREKTAVDQDFSFLEDPLTSSFRRAKGQGQVL